MQNMYPLSSQALPPSKRRISRRIQLRKPHATPRHGTRDCQIRGHREIMHQISKCERRARTPRKRNSLHRRLLRLHLSERVDQKDVLASTTLTSSNQEEAAAPHEPPRNPTSPNQAPPRKCPRPRLCRASTTSQGIERTSTTCDVRQDSSIHRSGSSSSSDEDSSAATPALDLPADCALS